MSKRLLILMCSIFLIVPLLFMGCGSGDTGSAGAAGAAGAAGGTGGTGPAGPGTVSNESCVVCHGAGQAYDVAKMHSVATSGLNVAGTVTVTIRNLVFGTPVGDNVPVSVNFDFSATNDLGLPIAQSATGLNLLATTTSSTTGITTLAYTRFYLATVIAGTRYPFPGGTVTQEPDEWYDYAESHAGRSARVPTGLVLNSYSATTNVGNYTYRFIDNTSFLDNTARISEGYLDNQVQRVGLQVSGLPVNLFTTSDLTKSAPYRNAVFDNVPAGALSTTVKKNDVSKAACQNCHAPDQAIAHGSRYDPAFCVTCHNPSLPRDGNLVVLVHKVHTSDNNVVIGTRTFDFSEVAYPQDIRNCDTCHSGTASTDNTTGTTFNNWKNVPSIEACGTCHTTVNFATGANHAGGIQANNSLCGVCHSSDLIVGYHADNNTTPNNVPAGLDNIVYFIDNVTVDNNFPVVTFHITKNGSPLTLSSPVVVPTGYTGSPAFLLAYALPQDGVTTPADYNNLGRAAGQPASVNLTGLTLTGTSAGYTTKLTTAFPAGATMRAVAIQSYWSQTVGAASVGRHTPAVVKAVTGDTVRRAIIDSNGCAACHKRFEGHGGSRVHNVQVCVVCHNPSLTSSGRTIDPAIAGGINPDITALFGADPLLYPEVPNNFKDMIHGIHSAFFRSAGGIEFVDIRNRVNGVIVLGNEVTFPGNLKFCTKCHIGTSYNPASIPDNVLLSTARITTGVASETRAQIIAARNQPNATDLVNSPIAAACYGCHATIPFASHMVQNGGDISSTRTGALLSIPWDLTLTP